MKPLNDHTPLLALSYILFDKALSRSPDLAYDIGANDGGMSRTIGYRARSIHSFEPVPQMYEKLVQVARDECKNVVPFNLGVSDKVEIIEGVNVFHAWTLLQDDGTRTDLAIESCDTSKMFQIRNTTIDTHSLWNGQPDFIKLDVDGYEFKVLVGGVKTLMEKPCPIYFEFSYMAERFFGADPMEMCELIYSLGYRACSLDNRFRAETAAEMMEFYPANTSYDLMLVHRDDDFLNE